MNSNRIINVILSIGIIVALIPMIWIGFNWANFLGGVVLICLLSIRYYDYENNKDAFVSKTEEVVK